MEQATSPPAEGWLLLFPAATIGYRTGTMTDPTGHEAPLRGARLTRPTALPLPLRPALSVGAVARQYHFQEGR